MASNRYAHSGMGNGIYGDVPVGAEFQISGMGNVTINGKCGRGAKIIKSGMGELYINGDVDEDVAFIISGMGNTKFAKRPPQSVLSKISRSGMGSISMPGGFELQSTPARTTMGSSSIVIGGGSVFISGSSIESIIARNGTVQVTKDGICTSYRGNSTSIRNGDLFIDGVAVTPSDARIIRNEEAVQATRSGSSTIATVLSYLTAAASVSAPTAAASTERKLTAEEIFMRNCSTYTRQYLEIFATKESHSDIVADLKLSPTELALFDGRCSDPISQEIMDRPVVLNERVYDLKTVLQFNGTDPYNRLKFEAREITPSRQTVVEFEKIIKQIESDRKSKLVASSASVSASPPGGISFR